MNLFEMFKGTVLEEVILQKTLEEGVKQGLEQGLEQGVRTSLLRFVETHFPDQLALAQQQVKLATTPAQIQELFDKLLVARTTDEVRIILLAIPHV